MKKLELTTKRHTPLSFHPIQQAYWNSPHRFNTVPSGRRSGKTELAKRKIVKRALMGTEFHIPHFGAGAPTYGQAKKIWWNDLKALIPKRFILDKSESDLTIKLINSVEIHVVGLDKPERVEGMPWDGFVLDEYASMKPKVWTDHLRPALSDRKGWCDFIGVPEGRNHYFNLCEHAKLMAMMEGDKSPWGHYSWKSADILPPEEIEAAKRDLDELTFKQEYEADFIVFQGQAYHSFNRDKHCAPLYHKYNPNAPLIITFDFNVSPGTATIIQEMDLPNGLYGTAVIGEVYIPRNSTTVHVCNRIINDWSGHKGMIYAYGDATGGASGTAKVAGSDWALVNDTLRPVFGSKLKLKVPRSNPRERVRLNAVNARLQNSLGEIKLMVDPVKAPHVVTDFEGVVLLEGGSGEIDKNKTPDLTHLTDGIGYYIIYEYPIASKSVTSGTY